ncbi:MAG TPA: carbohydrate ABC transporter permease [Chloroflexota bacterium]|nr:carbohydrate ABC transporter permease [Chloroflexota bacterium]
MAVRATRDTSSRLSWYPSPRWRRTLWQAVVYLIVVSGAAIAAFPFFWELTTAFKSPPEVSAWPPVWIPWPLHVENFSLVAGVVPLAQYLKNSVLVVGLVIVGTTVSCSMGAYAFARLRWPGRDLIFLVLLSALIIPGAVTTVPSFIVFQKIGWYNTLYPLIVPSFFGSAFNVFLLRQFFMTIPLEMDEAARIDGAGFPRIFLSIILPLSRPALATVAIFTFMGTWNDFFTPLVYLSDQQLFTLPLGLVFFQGSPHTAMQTQLLMAMSLLVVTPCIVVYFLAQRLFIQGIVITGVKG